MNTPSASISKGVVLLAAAMLPVQQLPSATGCCHGGCEGVPKSTAVSHDSCWSQMPKNCCSSLDGPGRLYCQHCQAQSDSSMPYKCSGECGGNNVPMAVDPAVGIVPPDDESAATVLVTIVADAAANTAADSLRRKASTNATSGSQRCVLLCRYRL